MTKAQSLIYDKSMPEFLPAMELIPSFKLVRRKSMLSEFKVGSGRIIMTGLVLNDDEPAGRFLKKELTRYLAGNKFVPAPEWSAEELKNRLNISFGKKRRVVAIDAGGRPIDL